MEINVFLLLDLIIFNIESIMCIYIMCVFACVCLGQGGSGGGGGAGSDGIMRGSGGWE